MKHKIPDCEKTLHMLELSKSAYGSIPSTNEKWIFISGVKYDVQLFIIFGGSELTIVFRGSSSVIDAKTDLRFAQMKIPYLTCNCDIKVHSGFINAYLSVRKKISEYITPGIKTVFLTGHSLGAAMSVLCAVDLQYRFPSINYDVTVFGCPRVGNRSFQKSYDRRIPKTLCFVNGNDAVTKLPPYIFGFCHVGSSIHIGGIKLPFVYSLTDHSISSYEKSISDSIICGGTNELCKTSQPTG